MQFNYEKETTDIISRLTQAGYSTKLITFHRRFYSALQKHLIASGVSFSMDTALKWIESQKQDLANYKYKQYRNSLYRLNKYLISGSIDRGYCRGIDDWHSRLTKQYEDLLQEFRVALSEKHRESVVECYALKCRDFLAFLVEKGLDSPAEMSIEQIYEYWHDCKTSSDSQKRRYVSAIVNLLTYCAERGDIPHCYSRVLLRDGVMTLMHSLKIEAVGNVFQPSKKIEPLAEEFLLSLDEQKYDASSKKYYWRDFINYFLFIEVNHFEYSPESVKLWLENSSRNLSQPLWKQRRHTLTLFAKYLSTGSTNKEYRYSWQPLQIDTLPDWSRSIVLDFIAERQREGLSMKTLTNCRLASCRFFKFLDSKGIFNSHEITAELVREFHKTDKHSTPEGKNAYGVKVRQLLSYMAEQKLVPQNLFLSISTQCAPCQNIVTVMNGDMVSAIYQYRENATTPLELRNTAIVLLGLRMGVRASDIVNLKINDFNWRNYTVSFVQQKTGKAITLHIPIDAGNSVYRYIMEGRPQSSAPGAGYVFIKHRAPFNRIKSAVPCRKALKSILSAHGLELPPGQGFHITRKTFATRLLISKNSIDDISNALGHTQMETAEVYLARDEDGMHLCPLPFESVGVV